MSERPSYVVEELFEERVRKDARHVATDLAALLNRARDLTVNVASVDEEGDYAVSWLLDGKVSTVDVAWNREEETWEVLETYAPGR